MIEFFDALQGVGLSAIPLIRTVTVIVILFIIFSYIFGLVKRLLIRKAHDKRQITDIQNFSRLFKIFVLIVLVIVGIFSYVGSFTGLGIAAGLFTAALGWALQRPITGVAAWIMVVVKRPFSIGDRVIIGSVKGDVRDITLTHIVMEEVGGLVDAEVVSGRIVMIPNYQLYEQNIINYTQQHDFVIGETVIQVTYESNLNKAIKIAHNAVMKHSAKAMHKLKQEPMVRVFMAGSGIDMKIRFYGEARGIQRIASDIAKDIYDQIRKSKDVEIAYPHMQLISGDKKGEKK